jgi:hypothetical protein
MLVDLAGVDPDLVAKRLRDAWGRGNRQVQVKSLNAQRHQYANLYRIASYMTKPRYTYAAEDRRLWLSNEDIAALALWRDRLPNQWHRFTIAVRV